jgi:hypothetical protein
MLTTHRSAQPRFHVPGSARDRAMPCRNMANVGHAPRSVRVRQRSTTAGRPRSPRTCASRPFGVAQRVWSSRAAPARLGGDRAPGVDHCDAEGAVGQTGRMVEPKEPLDVEGLLADDSGSIIPAAAVCDSVAFPTVVRRSPVSHRAYSHCAAVRPSVGEGELHRLIADFQHKPVNVVLAAPPPGLRYSTTSTSLHGCSSTSASSPRWTPKNRTRRFVMTIGTVANKPTERLWARLNARDPVSGRQTLSRSSGSRYVSTACLIRRAFRALGHHRPT